jgi:predicted amidohydrolase
LIPSSFHVAGVQFDIAWEDKPANHRIIEDLLAEADLPAGSLVVLPELGDSGFSFNLDRIADDQTTLWACRLARRLHVWLQAGHAIRGKDGRGRNCATLIDPRGAIAGTYHKVHPFSFGREAEHFSGGEHLLIRTCGAALVAPLVCYDLRFPELWRLAALAGAQVLTIGANWPQTRQPHWRALVLARAIENQAYVVAVNRIGSDPHLAYSGGSLIVSPTGIVLAEAGAEPAVLQAELDMQALRQWRAEFPALRDIRRELLGSFPVDAPIKSP